jgi:hypothetical protein
MGCIIESDSNSLIVTPKDGTKYEARDVERELNRIEEMLPELMAMPLPQSQALIKELELLPDFDLIGGRAEDGRVRDGNGRIVQLTSPEMMAEIDKKAELEQAKLSVPFDNAEAAFDRFSVGNPEFDKKNIRELARINREQITHALMSPDLSTQERDGLEFIQNNFEKLKDLDPYFMKNGISEAAIANLRLDETSVQKRPIDALTTDDDAYKRADISSRPETRRPSIPKDQYQKIEIDMESDIYSLFKLDGKYACPETNMPKNDHFGGF